MPSRGLGISCTRRAQPTTPSRFRRSAGYCFPPSAKTCGGMRIWARHPRCLEYSLRLSPRARVGSQPYVLGLAYFMNRQFDQASQHLQTAIQEQPGSPLVDRALAACYAHMGRLANARTGDGRTAASNELYRTATEHQLFPKPRAPRALPLGPALGGRRGEMTTEAVGRSGLVQCGVRPPLRSPRDWASR